MSKALAPAAFLRNLTSEQVEELVSADFVGSVALACSLPRWAVEEACVDFIADNICKALSNGDDCWAWYIMDNQESSALVSALRHRGKHQFLEAYKASYEI